MKKPTQAVYVRWLDSATREGWLRMLDPWSLGCSSIGWLIHEDEEGVTIAASMAETTHYPPSERQYDAESLMCIPRRAIVRMHVWKPPAWVILD